MANRVHVGLVAALAFVGGMTLACGGGTTDSAAPTTPAVPVPAATPTPTPAPVGFVCPLPPSSNPANYCPKLPARLGTYMNGAIDQVIAKRPELSDFNDLAGGTPRCSTGRSTTTR